MSVDKEIQFTALGGGSSIGASCYLVRIQDVTVLLDCGIDPGESPALTFSRIKERVQHSGVISSLADISAFALSHAHTDHSGLVPALHRYLRESRQGGALPRFYMSRVTQNLLPTVFRNVLRFSEGVPYTQPDVDRLLHDITYVLEPEANGGVVDIVWPERGKVQFYPSSHLLGSVMVEIEVGGATVLYSGDLRLGQSPVLAAGLLPEHQPDLLVVDGTYATAESREPQAWHVVRQKLFRILDASLLNKGAVLLPSFALGRAQEVLALVLQYLDTHPTAFFYVYLDGQARDLTESTLRQFRSLVDPSFLDLYTRYGSRIRPVDPEQDITDLRATEIEGYPAVIIASSGMLMPGSASHRWAKELASDPTAQIVTTGYLTEDMQEEVFARQMIANLRLAQTPDALPISGHSSLAETIHVIDTLSPKAILIVHCGTGDLQGKGSLLGELSSRGYRTAIAREENRFCITEQGVTIHGYRT